MKNAKRFTIITSVGLGFLGFSAHVLSGAYMFASENNPDIITHPTGYNGSGGVVQVEVCIAPGSANAQDMILPLENAVRTYNEMSASTQNLKVGVDNNVPSNNIDWESVALHEIGHCIGLAHPNLGSQAGVSGDATDFTNSGNGANDSFALDAGSDGIEGSLDDLRDDDVNLHWFRISNNNPFTLDATVDVLSYSRNLSDLPDGHSFAANGDRQVGSALGFDGAEVVMQQGTFTDEAQRELGPDDVASLQLGMAGLDEMAGTGDDYTIEMVFGGEKSGCDVEVSFDDTQTGFAVCKIRGFFQSSNHLVLGKLNGEQDCSTQQDPDRKCGVFFNTSANWFFNDQSNSDVIFQDRFESG